MAYKIKIFISYRREDASTVALLHDRLVRSVGHDNIVWDLDIPPGVDFQEYLNSQVVACNAMLVVIGPNWLNAKDDPGQPRLQQPSDFVAFEIAAALRRDIRVIPVLVKGAVMPRSTELPDFLRPLAKLNSKTINHETFHSDVDRLAKDISSDLPATAPRRSRRSLMEVIHDILDMGPSGSAGGPEQRQKPRLKTPPSVFVSHSSVDHLWVEREVVSFLKRNEIKTWYSDRSITSAREWEREILKGMKASKWFSLVVSPRLR